MPHDPKLRVIAKRTGQPMALVVAIWACLLDAASQHDPRGVIDVDPEEIAVAQDIDMQAVQEIVKAFYVKGMIDQENRLAAWNKRQHTTSTERSKKHRANKQQDATPRNGMQRDATAGNGGRRKNGKKAPDTETEKRTDRDSEIKNDSYDYLKARAKKEEREKEKPQSDGEDAKKKGNRILEQMLDIWNEEVQSKITRGQQATLTATRKEQMTMRWLEDFQQDMQAWRYYCEIIGASDFCLGKVPGKGWTINLSWAVESSDHVAKVLEGGFSGGNHPPRPPACHVPDLQAAWDGVLQAFEKERGKAVCRSWLANTVITGMERHRDGALLTMSCPSRFSREWIAQHYLADLNRLWAHATAKDVRVTGLELVTEA